MILKWLTGLALVFGLTYEAFGLDVDVVVHNGEPMIFLSGDYVEDDLSVFLSVAKQSPGVKIIALGNSDGGLTSESYPIGRYVRDNGYTTVIVEGAECVSSCTIVWMAGVEKSIEPGGVAMLHTPYVPAGMALEHIKADEYCDEEDVCRPWNNQEELEIYYIWSLDAIANFYDYMIEMGLEQKHIQKTLHTNTWNFYQIVG